jgi:TRAP-type C4-dicarboxylate transport system permease small subunit
LVPFQEIAVNRFSNIVDRLVRAFTFFGAFCLVGLMCLIVANVIVRPFGQVIMGTYELSELIIVITVSFALVFTALKKGHIAVDAITSRLPNRAQQILRCFSSFFFLSIIVLIAYTNFNFTRKVLLGGEETDLLKVPFLPFRLLWVLGLIFFCLVLFINLYKTLSQKEGK